MAHPSSRPSPAPEEALSPSGTTGGGDDTLALVQALLGQTSDSIVLVDPLTDSLVAFNEAAHQNLGYTREAFAKLRPRDLPADADEGTVAAVLSRALQGETVQLESRRRRADGRVDRVDLTLRAVQVKGKALVAVVARDISTDSARDLQMRRLNQAYAVLSAVNQAILEIRQPEPLFARVCRIAVEAGGFRLAWLGKLDEPSRVMRPVAQAGHSEGYVEALHLPMDTLLGTTSTAMLTGLPQVCDDIANDPRMAPWRDAALARGYGAVATFPISSGGVRGHCLAVYATAADHFDGQLIQLYGRLCQHLGFALEFIAAEQAQRQELRFRQQLVESVAGVFFAVDAEGCLVLWNRRLEEVSQLSAQQLAGRPVMELMQGAERTLMAVRLRAVLGSAEDDAAETQVEAALVARDGQQLPCLFVLRRIGLQGQPLVACNGIDIGDRVRSTQELARYHQHLEDLVATRTSELEAANGRMHREDRRLRAMLSLSQKASNLSEQQLFALGVAELARLTGSRVASLHAVDDAEQHFEVQGWYPELRSALGSAEEPRSALGNSGPSQVALPSAQGGLGAAQASGQAESPEPWHQALQRRAVTRSLPRTAEGGDAALCVPIFEGRQVRLVVCVSHRSVPYEATDERDLVLIGGDLWRIIRRRRIEIALEAAKRAADASSQAKSAFLANISHEIRTPMNAIIGFAHLIKRDPLTTRQVDHLGRIGEAGQHLLRLINDVLDFSKIEAQQVALEPTDFVLRDSVERVMAMVADPARSKGVVLQLAMQGCPTRLRADRLRLEQVLLNLVGNAVKFTHRGQVSVRVSRVAPVDPVASDTPALKLRFEVQDTGIGLAAEQVPRLFEPFEQADSSTTRRFGGTGLGLAICKRLVDLMQGQIGVHSQLGAGSLFWFELPVVLGPELAPLDRPKTPLPISQPVRGLRGAHVLLAEDNPVNQEVACELLEALGLVVDLAANGEQAVQRTRQVRYDLILMDMQMPVMDGLKAAAAIRQQAGPRVPIIAMTANAFVDDRVLCQAAGMDDFLSKPVEPETLRRCLERWLCPPAAVDDEPFQRTQLASVPALDVAQGLARVNGQWRLYWRALGLFATHHAGDAQQLVQLARTPQQRAALKNLAHALGGAAATLGATPLHARTSALEQAIAEHAHEPQTPLTHDALVALAGLAAEQLTLLLDGLKPLMVRGKDADGQAKHQVADVQPGVRQPAVATTAGNQLPELLACLQRLQPLLASHDTASSALLEEARPLLSAAIGPLAETLLLQVQSFNFEDARRSHALALQQVKALAEAQG